MNEIEELLQEAEKLQAEYERIEAIPFPAVRRYARRHFRPKIKHFLASVKAVQEGTSPNEPGRSGQI